MGKADSFPSVGAAMSLLSLGSPSSTAGMTGSSPREGAAIPQVLLGSPSGAGKASKWSTKEVQEIPLLQKPNEKYLHLENASEQGATCNCLGEILGAHSQYQEKPIKQAFYSARVARAWLVQSVKHKTLNPRVVGFEAHIGQPRWGSQNVTATTEEDAACSLQDL